MKSVPRDAADDPIHYLHLARHRFEMAMRTYMALCKRIEGGEHVGPEEAEIFARLYESAAINLNELRAKLKDDTTEHSSPANYSTLDFDAAKLAVGGLLDRLRASRDPAGIS